MNVHEYLQRESTPISLSRGDHVFRQGEPNRSVYFVTSGLAKAYYLTYEGTEQIKSFLTTGSFIGSLTACHSHAETTFGLMCIEDSTFNEVPFDQLRQLANSNIDVAQFVIEGLISLAMKKEQREFELLCMSAEDRFRRLREDNQSLLDRVTQNDIARYLGVTPVGLSRIKKRLDSQTTASRV